MKKFLRLFCILLSLVSFLPAQTQNPVIPEAVVKQLRSKGTFIRTNWEREWAAAVQQDGSVQYFVLGTEGGRFSVPANTVLLLHTHPVGDLPMPSVADMKASKQLGVPNCVVTMQQVWCAMPDGTVEEIQ
jgi:hypothetical protein